MQKLPPLELMQRAVRARVCPQCSDRPTDSESWTPDRERPCQADCTIFTNLPALRGIISRIHEDSLAPYEQAVNELICQTCESSPSAGDFCAKRSTRSCPLSRYVNLVIESFERLPNLV